MNERLASSTSPYLRAHAGNPVAWYAWGSEPFDAARRRDVPVLVSIGYSTCHWCHVMARESFEDPATADALNAAFVAVKVDREEHPEVDSVYMSAAAAFTRSLGWPLTVFATPAGRPFYAGTYFPPEPRAGVPSFRQVLAAVHEAWTSRRDEIDATGAAVVAALAEAGRAEHTGSDLPGADDVLAAARALAAHEDREHGGFGGADPAAPKFPVATALRFLQVPVIRRDAPEASAVADRAIAAMAASGLRDAVEGGFFRYATRRDWTVPHYERMLTDNAQLLDVVTASPNDVVDRAAVADGIARFLLDTLRQPSGGFGAAQDSESWIDGARSEGGYYARDAEGRATLSPPAVDGKVVTGWNGLAIGALARAGTAFGRDEWVRAAVRAADAVLEANRDRDGRLMRASLDEIASRSPATLADHGQLASGLVALAGATGEALYAVRARELVRACVTADGNLAPPAVDPVLSAQGIAAPGGTSDGDEPGGAAAVADAALQLWMLGGGPDLRGIAERVVEAAPVATAQPLAHGALLRVAALLAVPPRQVVVVSEKPDRALVGAAAALDADVRVRVTPAQAEEWAMDGFALLEGKTLRDGAAAVYDCRDFSCRMPVTDPAALAAS